MQFRLTYAGKLLATTSGNNRVDHKHAIRQAFHPQLRQYWQRHPFLQEWKGEKPPLSDPQAPVSRRPLMQVELAERFARCGCRFVPLVTRDIEVSCSLSILFLRPGWPGGPLHAGDIDNRLKTLFDALRLPSDRSQLGKHTTPLADEDPFFCLLEDDSLVTQVSVETDVLLEPVGAAPTPNDARLVITVSLGPMRVSLENMSFGGR